MPEQTTSKTAAGTKPETTATTEAKPTPKLSPERAALAKKVVRLRKTRPWKAICEQLNLTGSQARRLFHQGGGVSTFERRDVKTKSKSKAS